MKINKWVWLSSRGQWCFDTHVQKPVKSAITHSLTAIHIVTIKECFTKHSAQNRWQVCAALSVCRLIVLQVCSLLCLFITLFLKIWKMKKESYIANVSTVFPSSLTININWAKLDSDEEHFRLLLGLTPRQNCLTGNLN